MVLVGTWTLYYSRTCRASLWIVESINSTDCAPSSLSGVLAAPPSFSHFNEALAMDECDYLLWPIVVGNPVDMN